MAPRDLNQPSDSAADTVFGNLELDVDTLNGETGEEGLDDLDGDPGQDDPGDDVDPIGDEDAFAPPKQPERKPLDNLRLSQTDKTAKPFPKSAPVKPDAKGNLVDAQGKIVARAGNESRLYTAAHKARQDASAAQTQTQETRAKLERAVQIGTELNTELEKYKARDAQLQAFKMTPEDHIGALQLLSSLRTDTAGTLKKLLTRAAASGITVDSLGAGAGVDAKGILDLVREEIGKGLNPLKERSAAEEVARKQREEDERAAQAVQQEVNSFFNANQEAREYLPVFTKVLADPRYKNMSLGEIWARIQLNQARQPARSQTPRRGSPPNGRSFVPQTNSGIAPVESTYDEILKGILDEQGVA